MKTLAIAAIAMTALGSAAFSQEVSQRRPAGQPSNTSAQAKRDTGFYCDLTALSAEERRRHEEISKMLFSSLVSTRELEDGFEFEFPPDRSHYRALTEYTPMEHACCPFYDISIRLEREGGRLWLRLTGKEGVKAFIRSELLPWLKR